MKKKLIVAAVAVVVAVGAFTVKAHAVQEGGKSILVILCYDLGTGDVTGVGNTCSDGSGSCVPNFCND
jgi:hypothetical protein